MILIETVNYIDWFFKLTKTVLWNEIYIMKHVINKKCQAIIKLKLTFKNMDEKEKSKKRKRNKKKYKEF